MIRFNGVGTEIVERNGYDVPIENDFLIFEDLENGECETIDTGVWDGNYFIAVYPIRDAEDNDNFGRYIESLPLESLQDLHDNFPAIYEDYRKETK